MSYFLLAFICGLILSATILVALLILEIKKNV